MHVRVKFHTISVGFSSYDPLHTTSSTYERQFVLKIYQRFFEVLLLSYPVNRKSHKNLVDELRQEKSHGLKISFALREGSKPSRKHILKLLYCKAVIMNENRFLCDGMMFLLRLLCFKKVKLVEIEI